MNSYTYLSQNNVKKNKNDVINFILTIIKALDIGDYHSKIAVSRFTPTLFNDIHLNSVQTSQNIINFFETLKILEDDNSNETSLLLFPPLLPSVNEIVKETFSTSVNLYRQSPAYNVILLIFYVTDQLVESKINENLFHPNGPIFVFQITIGKMNNQIKVSQYTFSSLTIHYRANETKNLVELENYLLNGINNFTQISHFYDLRWWSYLHWNIKQCQRFNLKETIAFNEICDNYYSTTLQLGLSTKATITILGCVGGLLLILLSIIIINNSNVKQIQKEYHRKMSKVYNVVPPSKSDLNNTISYINENFNNKLNEHNNINSNIVDENKLLKNESSNSIILKDETKYIDKKDKIEKEFDFNKTFDILFLVDDSNSISNIIFDEYKLFINKFLDFLENSTSQIPQSSRIGVITFNRKPHLNIPFERYNSFKKLKIGINKLNRNGGVTNLGKALNFANGYLLGQKSIEILDNSHSDDKNILHERLQFLILLSDGHTKDTIDWEYQSLLREYSIFMVAIISKSYLDDMFIGLVKVGGKLMSLKDSDDLTKYIYKKFTLFNEK
ncbi:von Willebrand factor, type A domain-containing protein [Strongyloides ratti]|uniref:von Willebrand factor, type A domain-containing protein n=1 Tax=Strongyloides ratti TaxID=34506 RepID=A0A090MPK5_STRRB|nr:von Willebrand factor, type A domain-containing protein [Strongyloides ratti]CEF60047.1 von Willebrand factor, type A domain-containing protein [Strongyloides ratti]